MFKTLMIESYGKILLVEERHQFQSTANILLRDEVVT